MTDIVLGATKPYTDGRTASVPEGAYNVPTLQASVKAHYRALAGCRVYVF